MGATLQRVSWTLDPFPYERDSEMMVVWLGVVFLGIPGGSPSMKNHSCWSFLLVLVFERWLVFVAARHLFVPTAVQDCRWRVQYRFGVLRGFQPYC